FESRDVGEHGVVGCRFLEAEPAKDREHREQTECACAHENGEAPEGARQVTSHTCHLSWCAVGCFVHQGAGGGGGAGAGVNGHCSLGVWPGGKWNGSAPGGA